MPMAFSSKDLDYAAAELCAGRPERLAPAARELYAFVMDGANDHYKRLVDQGRRC